MNFIDKIILGDCEKILSGFPDNCIDLIFTSPPYADQRAKTYGGIKPDDYVEWFLPKTAQFFRVLKPTGTFILNIKERVVDGERHTYVIDLISKAREQGWLWTEEFIWHKKNSYPGKWPNRFRDNWERLIQFNKGKNFAMYQETVMVPVGSWAKERLAKLSDTDKTRDESRAGSGFGKNVSNWVGRDKVYPTNVLHMATETGNKNHSAVFPLDLPKWFIKLFTKPGDIVLDPFVGSGTTALAAIELGRSFVGIDINSEYVTLSRERIGESQLRLPAIAEKKANYIVAKNGKRRKTGKK
ncbi:MAG: Modification methylase PvuII [Anaerolineales bacterium]|nr:site-specific DNA-methyltransferase [Anaerolineae bacterium]MBL8106895.1 site-specific DNA-methyltransferase [Anaerolineales bacterium]MBV6400030.1 Modification methylase PvuII [Anaerolineales bacterium]MCC7189791.1 site-specific DNA-methyltransferase [Anaerolineales bacterium]